jgi:hypothetical protein
MGGFFMEMENFAKKGVSGTALGLSIGALGWQALNNGVLGNVLGGGRCCDNHGSDAAALIAAANMLGARGYGECSEDHCVNRYELGLQQELAAKDSKISLLESNIYVDSKIADVYERLNTKIGVIEHELCDQRVYNATNTATVSCLQQQIATLAALTKVVVPITNVCPQPAVATTPAAG